MIKKITILNFSPRKTGNCAAIAKEITEHFIALNVRQFEITSETIPACTGCNYECLTPGVVCPKLTQYQSELMDSVINSDLVYYIVPNICGYPCANYFSFNERSIGYFNMDRTKTEAFKSIDKRFIVVSNTESDNFRMSLAQQTNGEPKILYIKTSKYKKRSTAGDLMYSDEAKADLEEFLKLDT